MKRTLSLLLCLCMIIALVPVMTASAEAETISYLALPQGRLENVAAGKHVDVSSAVPCDNTFEYRNGKMLTDERVETYWESKADWGRNNNGNLSEGAFAVVDLGLVYPIYRIELVGEKAALQNYRIVGFDHVNFDYEDFNGNASLMMYNNTADGNNATLVTDNANGTGGWYTMYEGTSVQQAELATAYVNLNGVEARKIRIEKTAAEAAKFAEIRVYSILPELIDVTPAADAANIWTNGTPQHYALTNALNKNQASAAYISSGGSRVLVNVDLGAKYNVRRAELWTRSLDVTNNEGTAVKNFSFWTGNANSISDDITGSNGYKIGGVGIVSGLATGDGVSRSNIAAGGGATLIFEAVPTEPTQYVSLEWTPVNVNYWSFGEIRILAEKDAPELIDIVNVADFSKKTVNDVTGNVTVDLGGFYNVKKITATGTSGDFRIVGTSTETLGIDEAILAASPVGFDGTADYDVTMQNVVRYITFKPTDASAVLSDLKVYAEAGKSYENIAKGKSVTAQGGAAALTDGDVKTNGYSFHLYKGATTFAAANPIVVDLANSKKINALTLSFVNDRLVKAWERNMFQVYGANNADYSDAELLAVQGTRVAAPNHSWTVLLDTNKAYRYIVFGARQDSGHNTILSEERYYYNHRPGDYERFMGATTYYWPMNKDDLSAGFYSEVKTEKMWSEIQVFTEVLDIVNAAAGKADAENEFLTDGKTDEVVQMYEYPLTISLGKLYPVTNVQIDRAAASAINVSASTDGSSYTPVGTIAAGTTELDLAGASYAYIKLEAAGTAEVAEVMVNVDTKYYGKDVITEAYAFTDGSGAPINNLNSAELGVSITVKNINLAPQETVVVLGLFDENNTLLKVATSDLTIGAVQPGASQTYTAKVTNPGNLAQGSYIKAFVWEGLSAINPQTAAQSLVK